MAPPTNIFSTCFSIHFEAGTLNNDFIKILKNYRSHLAVDIVLVMTSNDLI